MISIMRLNKNRAVSAENADNTSRLTRLKKFIKWTAVALLWLGIWQFAAAAVGQEILIPRPAAAFSALCEMMKTADFWYSAAMSLLRIIAGYLLAVFGGIAGAVLASRFAVFKAVFSPILHLIRAVPVASFIILALVWIQSPYLPIFISFLMVLPMIWSCVESGIEGIDIKYLEMAKIYRLSPFKTLIHIKIPFILPSFIAEATSALGFAWKSGIAAEVICLPDGSLGKLLQNSKLYVEIPRMFALTAVVALLSVLLELLVKAAARRFSNDKHR